MPVYTVEATIAGKRYKATGPTADHAKRKLMDDHPKKILTEIVITDDIQLKPWSGR